MYFEKEVKMGHTKIDTILLDSPRQELSSGGLEIVVALLVRSGIIFSSEPPTPDSRWKVFHKIVAFICAGAAKTNNACNLEVIFIIFYNQQTKTFNTSQ